MPSRLTTHQLSTITREIETTFYYLEYPKNITKNLWKNGAGKKICMSDLALSHLQACISMVEGNISNLKKSLRQQQVIDAINILAEQKLDELRKAFHSKAKI